MNPKLVVCSQQKLPLNYQGENHSFLLKVPAPYIQTQLAMKVTRIFFALLMALLLWPSVSFAQISYNFKLAQGGLCTGATSVVLTSDLGDTYTWYENGQALTSTGDYQINGNRLTISNPAGKIGRTYYCYITLAGYIPNITNYVTLAYVSQVPSAAGTITGTKILYAGTSGITYSIQDIPGATSYTWTVPSGANITAGWGTKSITVAYSCTTVSENITVAGINSCGQGTSSSTAITVSNPKITCQPKNQNIAIGAMATFSIEASGPGLTYLWQSSSDGGNIWADISSATSSSYSVTASNSNNGNTYRCWVIDGCSNYICSNYAALLVEGKFISKTQANYFQTNSFNASGNVIGQTIAYFDNLGRSVQSQSRSLVTNGVMVTQAIYDRLGRPAISTLATPVLKTGLSYIDNYITNPSGAEYNYSNFDGKGSNPDAISGKLADYYSNANTLEPYAPNSAYPYVQTEYSALNPGVARKSTIAGEYHRIGSGHETQSYTMAVPEAELTGFVADFGTLDDVVLETKGVIKTIGVDANGNTSVVYTSANGQQISACYADATQAGTAVTGSFDQNTGYMDIHLVTAQTITFTSSCAIYDLSTDNLVGTFTSSAALPPGFYRVAYTSAIPAGAAINYVLNYKGRSFNLYDKAGRLIYSFSPKSYNEWKASAKDKTTIKNYASVNTYNSLGWILSSSSPDEGTTNFTYATDGRIRFSQNAQQLINGTFSYTNYDAATRPVESGECTASYATADATANIIANIAQWTRTFYNYAMDTVSNRGIAQNYTTGRVSKTSTSTDSTYYSYTYDGKIEWIVQKINGLGRKVIEYTYDDEITRRVSYVKYQGTCSDEFTHHYLYDADGRLEYVYTKTKNDASERLQAHYIYYAHGPLKRVELAGNLQGIDYVYTINGWLKSINHPDQVANDPGGDGYASGFNSSFKQDVFGMTLDYYSGDYTRSNTNITSTPPVPVYNGNIADTRWNTQGLHAGTGSQWMYRYTYNNLGFLKNADFSKTSGSVTNDFTERVTGYDDNGNITGLWRFYNTTFMDRLTYNYKPQSNKLDYVADAVGSSFTGTDIANQAAGNYTYNAIGQMIGDVKDNQYFTYDAYGHVTNIKNSSGTDLAKYTYNDKGFRIKKVTGSVTTWYVRDATGNILATYTGTSPILSEVNLYGSSRLGMAQCNTSTGAIEKYMYELTDHLGNVRATIAANASGGLDLLSRTDYYPFGMAIPGRNYVNGKADRYGYQGQYAEKDESGYNHFEARDYDARIGRWLIPDPAGQYYSPYLGMGNNPVSGVDPDGCLSETLANLLNLCLFDGSATVYFDQTKKTWAINQNYSIKGGGYYYDSELKSWTVDGSVVICPPIFELGDYITRKTKNSWFYCPKERGKQLYDCSGAVNFTNVFANCFALAASAGFGEMELYPLAGLEGGSITAVESTTTKLQSYVTRAANEVDAEGDAAFTPRQLQAIHRNPNLRAMYRGNRIDVRARAMIKKDPVLSSQLKSNYTKGPDFVDRITGRWWDMTTPGAWPAHEYKYGSGGSLLRTQ